MSFEDSKAKAPKRTVVPPSSAGNAPPRVPPPPSIVAKESRPYSLQRDYRVLEREQRVTAILTSGAFKNQLESILQGQISGARRPNKATRAQDTNADQNEAPRLQAGRGFPHPATTQPISPINDLRGLAGSKYTLVERQLRCKLAALYRLVDVLGWGQLFCNHITARGSSDREHYLVSPLGLLCQEVTASSLVRVTLAGEVVDPGTTQLGVGRDDLALHSIIHASREDVRCAVHLHATAGVAVSTMSCGLLPLSQEALNLGKVSYHNYMGAPCSEVEKQQLAQDLGPTNKVLFLRNHGFVAMGSTIEEAFYHTFHLIRACEIQVAAISAGVANLTRVAYGTRCGSTQGGEGEGGGGGAGDSRVWRTGDLEFESFMRMLDSKGYCTGYLYKALNLLEPAHASKRGGLLAGREKGDSKVEPKLTARPAPVIQQKLPHDKQELTPKRPAQVTGNSKRKDYWDFLEERESGKCRPVTKRTHLKGHRQVHAAVTDAAGISDHHEDLWGFLSSQHEDHRPRDKQEEPAKHDTSSLVNGTAVDEIHSHSSLEDDLEDHESQTNDSPPPKDRVPKHFGHVAPTGKLKGDLYKGHAFEIHRPADINPPPNLTPLELAQYTAERVAQSTSEAVEKLAVQVQARSPQELKITPATIPGSPQEASKVDEIHDAEANHTDKVLQNCNGHVLATPVEANDTVPLTHPSRHHNQTELQVHPVESHSHSTQSSPAHGWSADCLHHPASIEYPEGYSPAEKMVYAAQLVASSTSVAVQKLSSSLVEQHSLSSSAAYTDPI